MNTIGWRFETTEHLAALRPIVDGRELLEKYRNNQGLDPDRLLPPLAHVLFPTRQPRRLVVGACSCGETGCGSLVVTLRRVGNEVIWEPWEANGVETLSRDYRFELTQYLDAIDAAAEDRPGEGRGRRVSRRAKQALGFYDGRYDVLSQFHEAKVDWISAWPWTSDVVKASVTSLDGQVVHEFTAQPGESEEQFASRVCADLNQRRWPRKEA
jgi:hypothetical protein